MCLLLSDHLKTLMAESNGGQPFVLIQDNAKVHPTTPQKKDDALLSSSSHHSTTSSPSTTTTSTFSQQQQKQQKYALANRRVSSYDRIYDYQKTKCRWTSLLMDDNNSNHRRTSIRTTATRAISYDSGKPTAQQQHPTKNADFSSLPMKPTRRGSLLKSSSTTPKKSSPTHHHTPAGLTNCPLPPVLSNTPNNTSTMDSALVPPRRRESLSSSSPRTPRQFNSNNDVDDNDNDDDDVLIRKTAAALGGLMLQDKPLIRKTKSTSNHNKGHHHPGSLRRSHKSLAFSTETTTNEPFVPLDPKNGPSVLHSMSLTSMLMRPSTHQEKDDRRREQLPLRHNTSGNLKRKRGSANKGNNVQ